MMGKKYRNEFRGEGTHMVGVTRKGEEFLFDKEDLDVVQHFCWCKSGTGYIHTNDHTFGHIIIKMHRMVLKLEDPNILVDHINGNRLDNRKCNIRVCNRSENNKNQTLNPNNTSGYKGVSWFKETKKWRAYISINNKHVYLGLFESKEEAALAYK